MNRVTDLTDPRRCKGAAQDGQCVNVAEEGAEYCRAHGGISTVKQDDLRVYRLAKAQERTRHLELTDRYDSLKTLREEIALTRMLIEQIWNEASQADQLANRGAAISHQVMTLKELLKQSHQMEESMGVTLSKATIMKLGQMIVQIIVDELQDVPDYEAIVDRITDRLVQTISSTTNAEAAPLALPAPR